MPGTKRNAPVLSPSDILRFWSKVRILGLDECWNWKAFTEPTGYGRFWACGREHGAHVISRFISSGVWPNNLCTCHSCDNRSCCNPSHLFIGTEKDNLSDMSNKGRSCRGERGASSKLTDLKVIEIRRRYSEGTVSQESLAKEYGVQPSNIRFIVARLTWRHI